MSHRVDEDAKRLANQFIDVQIQAGRANFTRSKFIGWVDVQDIPYLYNKYTMLDAWANVKKERADEIDEFILKCKAERGAERNRIAAGVVSQNPQLPGESTDAYLDRLQPLINRAIRGW